jgi:hypothetical protein
VFPVRYGHNVHIKREAIPEKIHGGLKLFPVRYGRHGAVTFLSSSCLFMVTRAEWNPFKTHCYSENLTTPRIEPGTSALAARKSDHYTTEAVHSHKVHRLKMSVFLLYLRVTINGTLGIEITASATRRLMSMKKMVTKTLGKTVAHCLCSHHGAHMN